MLPCSVHRVASTCWMGSCSVCCLILIVPYIVHTLFTEGIETLFWRWKDLISFLCYWITMISELGHKYSLLFIAPMGGESVVIIPILQVGAQAHRHTIYTYTQRVQFKMCGTCSFKVLSIICHFNCSKHCSHYLLMQLRIWHFCKSGFRVSSQVPKQWRTHKLVTI